jgi:hypothetical protein
VVALFRVRFQTGKAKVGCREREDLVGVWSASGSLVLAEEYIVAAEELNVLTAGCLSGEDDVAVLVGVEVEELDPKLACDVRLVADVRVERRTVNLDNAVGARGIAFRSSRGRRRGHCKGGSHADGGHRHDAGQRTEMHGRLTKVTEVTPHGLDFGV